MFRCIIIIFFIIIFFYLLFAVFLGRVLLFRFVSLFAFGWNIQYNFVALVFLAQVVLFLGKVLYCVLLCCFWRGFLYLKLTFILLTLMKQRLCYTVCSACTLKTRMRFAHDLCV